MAKPTRISTGRGDKGTTSLTSGQRLGKDSLRVSAYGSVDELNAVIGVACTGGPTEKVAAMLNRIQGELFRLGSDLAVAEPEKASLSLPGIEEQDVRALAVEIDALIAEVGPVHHFVFPGGCPVAALLHVARTVCRRAERDVVALARSEAVNPAALVYLNRLSDELFAMALYENHLRGVAERTWKRPG